MFPNVAYRATVYRTGVAMIDWHDIKVAYSLKSREFTYFVPDWYLQVKT